MASCCAVLINCPFSPHISEVFKLNPAAIAVNGMYKGVARLVGMQMLPVIGCNHRR